MAKIPAEAIHMASTRPRSPVPGDVSIVLAGEAGQGIQTIEQLLTRALKRCGWHVFASKEYMSRIRGGTNSMQIRVSEKRVGCPRDRVDFFLPFDKPALRHLEKRLSPDTVILGEKIRLGSERPVIDVPLSALADEIGDAIYTNVIASGLFAGLLGAPSDKLEDLIGEFFARKDAAVVEKNKRAAAEGQRLGREIAEKNGIKAQLKIDPAVRDEWLLSGGEAITCGAIAGGCNFLSSYPMSPSTPVLVGLAKNAAKFGVVVEQAEDEISAINMALGAWYAGARAMVTTSGGGFALMAEGMSLAGMIESPLVVHLAQRPGPATGLPTRTEQGDLELALYSGHGDFPRLILAPGTLEQAFDLTQRAFNLADKWQMPVIVLSDQYLVDSFCNLPAMDLSGVKIEKHHVPATAAGYRRFALTPDGISPRGLPGCGEGLVGVDSDEHDEEGHITESMETRSFMVEKRMAKMSVASSSVMDPELIGDKKAKTLVACWGSTYHAVKEALAELGRPDVAALHFRQLYPLNDKAVAPLLRAKRGILVENNATGQFGKLIRMLFGYEFKNRILKYDGLALSVEEITAGLKKALS